MATKEYHAQKSRECYQRKAVDPEWVAARSAYTAERRRTKKTKAVQHFGGICNHCKQKYPDAVFEFHHLDPAAKEVTPAALFMHSDKRIYAELAKCIMLCANCHRIEHAKIS